MVIASGTIFVLLMSLFCFLVLTGKVAFWQMLTPPHLPGRIISLQLMGSTGLQPVSFLLSGWAIGVMGLFGLFLIGGATVAVACVGSMPLPAVRHPLQPIESGK